MLFRSLRYTAVGNAVSVPVVEWIAGRIRKELNTEYSSFEKETVTTYVPEFAKATWTEKKLEEIDFTDTSLVHKWPKAGLAWESSIIGSSMAPTPGSPISSNLLNIVDRDRVSRKYYLTPNAAEGIIRRVDNQGRTLFAPLRTALEIEKSKK